MAALGGYLSYLAFEAWRDPGGRFAQRNLVEIYPTRDVAGPIARFLGQTRERMGPQQIWGVRFLGVIVGPIFFSIGCYMTIDAIACGFFIPKLGGIIRPLFGPLAFRFHPILIAWIAFVVFIMVSNTWSSKLSMRILLPILAAFWAIAGFEAAWFHTGEMANRWGVISFALPIAWLISAYIWNWFRRASPQTP